MKLLSWNVNGIRAAEKNGFLDVLKSEDADLVCLQEIKAFPAQLSTSLRCTPGFQVYWHPAEKPGYSGLALYSKHEPKRVQYGIGAPEIDREGRVLVAEFKNFVLINAYFPNSQRDHARLGYKLSFCRKFFKFCESLKADGKNLVICGDFNIAHKEIDLKNPKSNMDNAGFLPEERAWLDEFTGEGGNHIDTFRHFVKDPGHYSWWSYRPGVREKNIGWRLDYFFVNEAMEKRLKSAEIYPHISGSDHCPVGLCLG